MSEIPTGDARLAAFIAHFERRIIEAGEEAGRQTRLPQSASIQQTNNAVRAAMVEVRHAIRMAALEVGITTAVNNPNPRLTPQPSGPTPAERQAV